MISGLPFDDFRQLLADLPGPNLAARDEALDVNSRAEARDGALGRAGDVAVWLAAWRGKRPGILKPQIGLFGGTHGIADRLPGSPRNAVQELVERCGIGGASINQLCAAGDYGLKVFDLALDVPTADMTTGAALDERGCAATIAFGMEALAGGTDLVVLSGFGGRAGQISASAVLSALLNSRLDGEGGIADAALQHHAGHLADPLEVLRRVGGREIAALAGAIVAARTQHVPVILDGIAAIAAAAVVQAVAAGGIDHCLVADSGGPLLADNLVVMNIEPIMSLGMASVDGSAGAIAACVVQAAAHCHAAYGAGRSNNSI